MTLHLGKFFGLNLRRMVDAEHGTWLCGVIWYPRSRKRLGYLYPSIRWF
jgi:hypothetical protein